MHERPLPPDPFPAAPDDAAWLPAIRVGRLLFRGEDRLAEAAAAALGAAVTGLVARS